VVEKCQLGTKHSVDTATPWRLASTSLSNPVYLGTLW